MTHDNKDGGCCGSHDKHSHQEKPEKEKGACCDDKEKGAEKPEQDKSDNSGGCCGGH